MAPSAARQIRKALVSEKDMNVFDDEYPYGTEFFKLLALCNTVVCEYNKDT